MCSKRINLNFNLINAQIDFKNKINTKPEETENSLGLLFL